MPLVDDEPVDDDVPLEGPFADSVPVEDPEVDAASPEPPVADPSPDPAAEPDAESDDAAGLCEREVELRSFLAQPDPLKWIDGALNAFRTGAAPQTGQRSGPSAVTEWMTSKR